MSAVEPIEWETIVAKYISERGLITRIQKEFNKVVRNQTINRLVKWTHSSQNIKYNSQ